MILLLAVRGSELDGVVRFALADLRVDSVIVDVRKTQIVPEAKGVGVVIRRQRGSSKF